jgi:hypothetical protein
VFDALAEQFPDAIEQEEEFDLVAAAGELFETEEAVEVLGDSTVQQLREQLETLDGTLPVLTVDEGDFVAVGGDSEQRLRLAEQVSDPLTTRLSYRDQLSLVSESLDAAGGTFLATVPAPRLDPEEDTPLAVCGRRAALAAVVNLVKSSEREVRELEDVGLTRVSGDFVETLLIILIGVLIAAGVTAAVAGLICSGGNDTACDVSRIAGYVFVGAALLYCVLTGFAPPCEVDVTQNTAGASMTMATADVDGGFGGG